MAEERLKLAVFIDYDNVQIGVKDTLGKEFDVSLVLEALKERGEVVTKVAYGDWPRAGEQSRQMTAHAVQMVQRNLTPRGDKNGADINLALDALEMAFNRPHINAFAIVGGDSDFITLVEKLKQYDKRVFVVGGRAFTSNILQRNCHEFISYENLLKAEEGARAPRASRARPRAVPDSRPLATALPNVERALKILAEREVAPQVGLLKSTLLQLDPTFSERDFGAGSFLEFMQKMERARLVHLRKTERGFLVEPADGEVETTAAAQVVTTEGEAEKAEEAAPPEAPGEPVPPSAPPPGMTSAEALGALKQAMADTGQKAPGRPLYLRQVSQMLRAAGKELDARRHGFRGILDLLHQAQREGWLRLHRDHKGVWRIFPVTVVAEGAPAPTPVAAAVPAVEAPATDFVPVEVNVSWEEPAPAAEETAVEAVPAEQVPSLVVEEAAPAPPAAERKARKPRAAKASGKSGPRKTAARRKPKEPAPQ
ncbi:MAG: NYN domain-containing protein [Terriglobia bacterium]